MRGTLLRWALCEGASAYMGVEQCCIRDYQREHVVSLPLQVEDIDLSKNTLFLRMMPRIDYNRKRGSQRSVSAGGEGRGGEDW